jgi:hypothetical protein
VSFLCHCRSTPSNKKWHSRVSPRPPEPSAPAPDGPYYPSSNGHHDSHRSAVSSNHTAPSLQRANSNGTSNGYNSQHNDLELAVIGPRLQHGVRFNSRGRAVRFATPQAHRLITTPVIALVCIAMLIWQFSVNDWKIESLAINPAVGKCAQRYQSLLHVACATEPLMIVHVIPYLTEQLLFDCFVIRLCCVLCVCGRCECRNNDILWCQAYT